MASNLESWTGLESKEFSVQDEDKDISQQDLKYAVATVGQEGNHVYRVLPSGNPRWATMIIQHGLEHRPPPLPKTLNTLQGRGGIPPQKLAVPKRARCGVQLLSSTKLWGAYYGVMGLWGYGAGPVPKQPARLPAIPLSKGGTCANPLSRGPPLRARHAHGAGGFVRAPTSPGGQVQGQNCELMEKPTWPGL